MGAKRPSARHSAEGPPNPKQEVRTGKAEPHGHLSPPSPLSFGGHGWSVHCLLFSPFPSLSTTYKDLLLAFVWGQDIAGFVWGQDKETLLIFPSHCK